MINVAVQISSRVKGCIGHLLLRTASPDLHNIRREGLWITAGSYDDYCDVAAGHRQYSGLTEGPRLGEAYKRPNRLPENQCGKIPYEKSRPPAQAQRAVFRLLVNKDC